MNKSSLITIKECGESLESLDPNKFILHSIYFEQGIADTSEIKLRSGVVERLRKSQNYLQTIDGCKGWKIKIWDGFRLIKVQDKLYKDYYHDLKKDHPDWTDGQIRDQVERFVFPPSTNPSSPSPHNTGGAVDLTLVDDKGKDVPMGTEFDAFTEKSHTDYFNKQGKTEDQADSFHANRMLLKKVLEHSGLSNYPFEWWHFNFGNQEWALRTDHDTAIYGSAEI